jgi:hypothetical protein
MQDKVSRSIELLTEVSNEIKVDLQFTLNLSAVVDFEDAGFLLVAGFKIKTEGVA